MFGIHIPPLTIEEQLNAASLLGTNLELNIDTRYIDSFNDDYESMVLRYTSEKRLTLSIHGPFMDLNMGSIDVDIVNVSRRKIERAIKIANNLDAHNIVFHSGYIPQYYSGIQKLWMQRFIESWSKILQNYSGNTLIFIENHFEESPSLILDVINAVNNSKLGACLDISHAELYSNYDIQYWLTILKNHLNEIHLNDYNHGVDTHQALGTGKANISGLLNYVKQIDISPLFTIEVLTVNDANKSIQYLEGL